MYWFLYTTFLVRFRRCNRAPWKKKLISSPDHPLLLSIRIDELTFFSRAPDEEGYVAEIA